MAKAYISEYVDLPVFIGQGIMAAVEPAVATQAVSFTGTAGASAAFNAKTKFIRVHVDAAASFKFGTGTPVALVSDPRLAASSTEFFGIPVSPGSYKVSFIASDVP